MRIGILAGILAVIAGLAALNLLWGGLWLGTVAGTLWLRRRVRLAPVLLLVGLSALLGAGLRGGWLLRPEQPVRARPPAAPGAPSSARQLVEARLRAIARDESPAADVEGRAAAAVGLSRRLGPWRPLAPQAVAAVEVAVRRLALTLTAPEFRDIEARRRELVRWVEELEDRLATAADESEIRAVARALEPSVLARVSLRPVVEDLARVEAAVRGLVAALGGGDVLVTARVRLAYQEGPSAVVDETRYEIAARPPLRLVKVDVRPLRLRADDPGAEQVLAAEGADGAWVDLRRQGEQVMPAGDGGRVVLLDRTHRRVAATVVRTLLRPLPFRGVWIGTDAGGAHRLVVTVEPGRAAGLELPLAVPLPPRELREVRAPRYSLYRVSVPGTTGPEEGADDWDRWTPVAGGPAGESTAEPAVPGIWIELVPATALLRNRLGAALVPHAVEPTAAAGLVVVTLGVAAVVVGPRRRTGDQRPA